MTPTLAQAAEAVLRGALEPALAMRSETYQREVAAKASPCKHIALQLGQDKVLGACLPIHRIPPASLKGAARARPRQKCWMPAKPRPCQPRLQTSQAKALTPGLCWQAAMVAVCACVHCEPEPGDTSAMALVATLRKRLLPARSLLPPYVRKLQVWMKP